MAADVADARVAIAGAARDVRAPQSQTSTATSAATLQEDQEPEADDLSEDACEAKLEKLRIRRADNQKRIEELDAFWDQKSGALHSEIQKQAGLLEKTHLELEELLRPPERTYLGPSWLTWVESHWFNLLASLIVIANLVAMSREAMKEPQPEWLDNVFLLYFTVELVLRAGLHQRDFLYGCTPLALANWLDLVIVVSGLVYLATPVSLSWLRVLRVARLLKLFNVFMREDISWTERDGFQFFIMVAIAVSSISMSLQADYPDLKCWAYWEQLVLSVFAFELAARMKQAGLAEFFLGADDWFWNYFDLCIVGTGVIDLWMMPLIHMVKYFAGVPEGHGEGSLMRILSLLRILRLFRILRLVRLVRGIPPLYNLVQGIAHAMAGMVWVVVLTVVIIYAFGLLTVSILRDGILEVDCSTADSKGDREAMCPFEVAKDGTHGESNHPRCTFHSVSHTMFLLFELMNTHMSAFEDMLPCVPWIKPAMGVYMALSCMTILPTLTAVISENMLNAREERKEKEQKEAEVSALEHKRAILNELFDSIDTSGDGQINRKEFDEMLKQPFLSDMLAVTANLKVTEMRSLFDLLERDENVDREAFFRGLLAGTQEVRERSMMRFAKRITEMEDMASYLAWTVHGTRRELCWLNHHALRPEEASLAGRPQLNGL